MTTNNDIPAGYYLRMNSKRTCWLIDGPDGWKHVGLRGGSRATALVIIEAHIASLTARPAVPTEPAPTTMPTGWSDAAKARAGRPASRDVVGDALGLRSPAAQGTCHYCGLNARSCDCH